MHERGRSRSGAGTTRHLYSGDELVAEYHHAMLWYKVAGLGDRRSLHTNYQGSVVSVADALGNLITVNSYDEYGIPSGLQSGSGVTSNLGRFQYTGQAWLPELGVYYYKARIYSPTLGRFLQTDPIGYKDQINLYACVANDPVSRGDPTDYVRRMWQPSGRHDIRSG